MTVTHDDLRAGRLNIYRLTDHEAKDIVDEYDTAVAELDLLRKECAALKRQLSISGTELLAEYDAVVAERDLLREENKTLLLKQEDMMTDDTDTPAGWTIVSIGDDGSVLCQSRSGCRRRYWFQVAEVDRLRAENERLRELLTEAVFDGSTQSNDWLDRVHKLLGRE